MNASDMLLCCWAYTNDDHNNNIRTFYCISCIYIFYPYKLFGRSAIELNIYIIICIYVQYYHIDFLYVYEADDDVCLILCTYILYTYST